MDYTEFVNFCSTHSPTEASRHFGISKATVSYYARKFGLPRKSFKHKDIEGSLSDYQQQLIIGSLLGDGHLEKPETSGSNSRFCEKHGISQLTYLKWKYDCLLPFSSKFKVGKESVDDRAKEYCEMRSIRHPLFTTLRHLWYPNGKKQIPKTELSPLSIAVWFFDDGYNNVGKNISIFTNSFSDDEVEWLLFQLRQHGINNCSIHYSSMKKNRRPIVFIRKSSRLDFLDLVSSYVPVPALNYKIRKA